MILDALVGSVDVLIMLFFMLLVLLVVFATIMYYIEGDIDGSLMDSIPQTMYYIQARGGQGLECVYVCVFGRRRHS